MSNAFAPIVRARPIPIFGRPVHQGSPPIDYSPILLLKPFGFRIAPDTLSSDENLVGQRGITPAFGYSAPHPSAEGTSTLLIHALPSAHYGSVRPSAPRRYSRLAVFAAWASPLASERLVPAVPRKSLHPLHAPSTPVAVCPVIRPLTDLSQKGFTLLVLTTLASLRRVFEGFTFVRLSDAHLHEIDLALFLQRSPPRLFTAAAWSGLGPAPENRSRGANPHLSRSLSTRLVSP